MKFEWEESKNRKNIEKHGISFERVLAVFDKVILSYPDTRKEYGETRVISIGEIENTIVVVVVHTERNGAIRLISARPANRKERRKYNDYKQKSEEE